MDWHRWEGAKRARDEAVVKEEPPKALKPEPSRADIAAKAEPDQLAVIKPEPSALRASILEKIEDLLIAAGKCCPCSKKHGKRMARTLGDKNLEGLFMNSAGRCDVIIGKLATRRAVFDHAANLAASSDVHAMVRDAMGLKFGGPDGELFGSEAARLIFSGGVVESTQDAARRFADQARNEGFEAGAEATRIEAQHRVDELTQKLNVSHVRN